MSATGIIETRHRVGNDGELEGENIYAKPSNVFDVGTGLAFEATFDRILVLEDEFKSGYECQKCKQVGKIICEDCNGVGKSRLNDLIRCTTCQGEGKLKCVECNGVGELLVVPEVAKRRPTTGRVVSAGSEVKETKIGDAVLYSTYCGEVLDLSGLDIDGKESTIVLRILKERETICRVTGNMELRRAPKRTIQAGG